MTSGLQIRTGTLPLLVALTLLGLALLSGPRIARADATDTSAVTYPIDATRVITISPSGTLSFSPTASQILAGETTAQTLTCTLKTNCAWQLKIKGSSAGWTPNRQNGSTKPVGDIKYSSDGGASFTALTTSDASITSGGATGSAGTVASVQVKVAIDFQQDSPQSYSYNSIIFTLSQ